MTKLTIQPATLRDTSDIVLLDNIAGHGISLWFWLRETKTGLIEDALALGRQRMAASDAFYGVSNAIVAIENDMVQGSVISYLMPKPDHESEQIKRDAPAFLPVFELFDKCQNDWFVDSLAVYPEARGKGVGAQLLDAALEKGRLLNYETTKLVVEDSNIPAIKLYESRGFSAVEGKPYIEFNGPSKTKEWVLFERSLI